VVEAPVKHTKGDGTPIEGKRCPLLLKTPFCCNPCERRRRQCSFQKQLYIAKNAHAEYATLLQEAREGIPLNNDEFWEADAVITAGIKKGQRLYHIMETHDIGFSKSTAYRNLHRGYLSISRTDMLRVVKFKKRKQYRTDTVPKVVRAGRTYADFQAFIDERGITSWVEMDTVIGRVGGKVIMTFNFTRDNFMFGLLLDNKTAKKNHTLFRDIVPKGESFDHFTQDTVNLIFSHVNSVKRKVLNSKTPYEMFSFVYGETVAELLGISEIPATEAIQSPKLLKNLAKSPPENRPHTDVSMPGQNGGDFCG
jgi:IS30 family transposase